jgi:hypothetical protein
MGVHWNGTLIADVLNPANNPSGGPGTWVQYTYTGLEAESTSTVFQINGRQDPAGIFFRRFFC